MALYKSTGFERMEAILTKVKTKAVYKVFLWEHKCLFGWKVENINMRPLWSENMVDFKLHLLKEYFKTWKPDVSCCLK